MNETQRLVLSIVILVISIGVFIFFLIFTRRKSSYRLNVLKAIEQGNKQYYLSLKLKDDIYFPYYPRLKSGFKYDFKSPGEEDVISNIKLNKHYSFLDERVIYIINNELHYPMNKVTIDNQEYILIDKRIKTIEMLISNDLPSHFLIKFEFNHKDGKITYAVEEVVDNGFRNSETK